MKYRITQACVVLGVSVAGACSDASGPEDSLAEALLTRDVAMVAADAALEDLADMGQLMVGGVLPAPPEDGTGSFTRTVTFYDAAGIEQPSHDPVTTASIHMVMDGTREFSRDSWTASGTRERDLTITGLEGEEITRTVNGTGSGTLIRSSHADTDGARTYDMFTNSVIENVVHPVPRTDESWPLSGTITREITVTVTDGPDGDVTRSRTVVITFDGTNWAQMAVVGGDSFEVDLSTRSGRHPFRKRGQ